jgi:mRNA-degrading endonuclease RelE of RelBE toxin-antitoxin system
VEEQIRLDNSAPGANTAMVLREHQSDAVAAHALSASEAIAIDSAANSLMAGTIITLASPAGVALLRTLLSDNDSFDEVLKENRKSRLRASCISDIRFKEAEPRRMVIFSEDFIKSVAKIDKKLQGRILEALAKITEAPTTIIGDTVKPLSGDLKGLWRYRIGDYRLVYDPNVA